MAPSSLLRATLPLRSSSSLSFLCSSSTVTNSLSAVYRSSCNRGSILSSPSRAAISRRAASTSTPENNQPQQHRQPPPPSSPQQQQQQQQQEESLSSSSSSTPSTTTPSSLPSSSSLSTSPPSLRKYPYTLKVGTVTSVGLMDRTVRVAHRHNTWDRHIRKMYPKVTTYLVSDPRNSLREGDVIEFSSGARKSRHVRHVVERIIAPFGVGIDERPAVMTREEREAEREMKRAAKVERRMQRWAESGDGATARPVKEHVGRIRGLILERIGEEEKRKQAQAQAQTQA